MTDRGLPAGDILPTIFALYTRVPEKQGSEVELEFRFQIDQRKETEPRKRRGLFNPHP